MVRPTVYGQLHHLPRGSVPLLTFQGVEGKTFSPMAITLMVALASAFAPSPTSCRRCSQSLSRERSARPK